MTARTGCPRLPPKAVAAVAGQAGQHVVDHRRVGRPGGWQVNGPFPISSYFGEGGRALAGESGTHGVFQDRAGEGGAPAAAVDQVHRRVGNERVQAGGGEPELAADRGQLAGGAAEHDHLGDGVSLAEPGTQQGNLHRCSPLPAARHEPVPGQPADRPGSLDPTLNDTVSSPSEECEEPER